MSKLSHILGHRNKPTKRERKRRLLMSLVHEYPDLWPLAVRDGTMDVMDMPADSVDWACNEIIARRNACR